MRRDIATGSQEASGRTQSASVSGRSNLPCPDGLLQRISGRGPRAEGIIDELRGFRSPLTEIVVDVDNRNTRGANSLFRRASLGASGRARRSIRSPSGNSKMIYDVDQDQSRGRPVRGVVVCHDLYLSSRGLYAGCQPRLLLFNAFCCFSQTVTG